MVTVFSLLAVALIVPAQVNAKDTYWLLGVSKPAGGNMRMYYNGNTITLQGKIKKAAY